MWSNKPFTTMRSNAATPKPVTAPTSPAIDDDLRRLLDDSARSVSGVRSSGCQPAAHA